MMKPKQEQIEEMAKQMCGDKDTFAKDLCSCCIAWDDCLEEAGNLHAVGYRKARDVIEKEENEISFRRYGKGIGISTIFRIADEMRQEVEK